MRGRFDSACIPAFIKALLLPSSLLFSVVTVSSRLTSHFALGRPQVVLFQSVFPGLEELHASSCGIQTLATESALLHS